MNEIDNETDAATDAATDAWGWDNRLGRDCEKVWGFGPSNSVLPRGAQSLEALYRDLQASAGQAAQAGQAQRLDGGESIMKVSWKYPESMWHLL